jgi:phosphoribosylformimino-5-aminoimidazole carboxamide ribotide isomerase
MRDPTWIVSRILNGVPDVMLYAAGGLRGASDLVRLKQAGKWGVLVASALHDGRLTGADLAAAASKVAGDAE